MAELTTNWLLQPLVYERARKLGDDLGLIGEHGFVIGQLLINRGIVELADARRYLSPRLADLRSPSGALPMAGFAGAVTRVLAALDNAETIGVFGDYDVDGVTSCALLTTYLRQLGGNIVPRVARRDAGYGFGNEDVDAFAAAGCRLIITCDCGTSDHEALARAKSGGVDVIVVDHHQVPDPMPDAFALINPHQPGCQFPFKGLASVGVAFYLAAALRTQRKANGKDAPDPRDLLDLVAVGTIADLAPLTFENRILVHAGFLVLQQNRRPGLRALCEVAGLSGGIDRASAVAFRLTPRLNAPGRLGNAQLALELMLAPNMEEAMKLAQACDDANVARQKLQERVMDAALEQAQTQRDRAVIVVSGQGWSSGVVGIIAAKLVERFGKPAVAIALDGNTGRGSARTLGGFNLYEAFKRSADLFVRYGGHAAAAGLTIESKNIGALADALHVAGTEAFGNRPPTTQIDVDAEIALDAITETLAVALAQMEPFGMGNPEPCLSTRGATVERSKVVKELHLQLTLRQGTSSCDGIAFRFGAKDPGEGTRISALFVPELDTYRGNRRVRLRFRDLRVDRDDPQLELNR